MKKNIKVVFTGGTISMNKLSNGQGVGISSSQMPFEKDLKKMFPNLNLTFDTFSMVPSPFLEIEDLFSLTKRIELYANDNLIDAVVISHGTDTLEESSFMADLYLQTNKPVIFTGSMRNYSEVSYDGLGNLMSSILVASSDESKGQGVLIVFNDEINAASETTKTHTLSLNTFKSLEFGPLGIIDDQHVIYYRKKANIIRHIRPESINDKVEIVKISAGSSSLIVNLLIDSRFEGIVIEALGRGNVPPKVVPGIERALALGIPVVLTSRSPMGRVLGTYAYEGGGAALEKLGVIFAPNLNSQKARIKLIMLLGSNINEKDMVKYF